MAQRRTGLSIRLGAVHVTIEAPQAARDELAAVFVDQIVRDRSDDVVEVTGPPGRERISLGGRQWNPRPHDRLSDQLLYMLMRTHLDRYPDLLHLHAGFVSSGDRGVLVAGPPGAGKSTMILRLVEDGFAYGTDERVTVIADATVVPFGKPISLMSGSAQVVEAVVPSLRVRRPEAEGIWHIPASEVRPGACDGLAASAHKLVIASFEAGAPSSMERLDAVEATALLLDDLPWGATHRVRDLEETARLVAQLDTYRVTTGDGRAFAPMVREVLAEPSVPVEVESVVPGSATGGGRHRPRVRAGVSAVRLGDRFVATAPRSTSVVELDEVSASWLGLLDGSESLDTLTQSVGAEFDLPVAQVEQLAKDVVDRLTAAKLVK